MTRVSLVHGAIRYHAVFGWTVVYLWQIRVYRIIKMVPQTLYSRKIKTMPVKITTTTDPAAGTISGEDLSKMKNDFINEVQVLPYNGRVKAVKKFSVALTVDEVKELIAHYEKKGGIDVIQLNLSLNLDPFVACNGTKLSGSLTVVVEAATWITGYPIYLPHNSDGDIVCIPGFGDFAGGKTRTGGGSSPCCPSSNP
jgi:hypothetical protein